MFKEEPQIYLNIKFNNTEEALPVNPEKLQITRGANNADIDIIGLGPATRKGHPGLISMKISSFFPHLNSPFNYFGKSPEHYIKFLNEIWEADNDNNRVATLTTIGLTPKIDTLPFVIENFDYEHRGGDFDIYYNLSIKEYVPYGAKVKTISSEGTKTSRIASGEVSKSKTYTVVRGDTLSGITKRCTGGTGSWQALYELNKAVIGSDPDVIRIGQVLTLPDDWSAPVKSTVSTTSKKSSTSKKVPMSKTIISTETIIRGNTVYKKINYSNGDSEIVLADEKIMNPEMLAMLAKQRELNESVIPGFGNKTQDNANKILTSDSGARIVQYSKSYDAIKEAQEKLAKDASDKEAAKELEIAEKTAKANEIFLANRLNQTQKVPEKPGNTKPTPSITPPSR